jgi:nitrate/nitrite transporter NarK
MAASEMARLLFQLVGTLLLVAWVMHFMGWIILFAAVAAVVWVCRRGYDEQERIAAAKQRRLDELVARADQQHAWTMSGDDRGLYGEYPPAVRTDEKALRSEPR